MIEEPVHGAIHVERVVLHEAAPFDKDRPRKWFTLDTLWKGERARYLMPLTFSDRGHVPVLVASSGKGCYVQRGFMAHRKIEREGKDAIEYDRVVWQIVEKDCHHPTIGHLIVVIEPYPKYTVSSEGKVEVEWGGEMPAPNFTDYRTMSRAALIADLKDALAAMKSDLSTPPVDISEQEQFIASLEEQERELASKCFDQDTVGVHPPEAAPFDPDFNCPTHFAGGDPTCPACLSKQPRPLGQESP